MGATKNRWRVPGKSLKGRRLYRGRPPRTRLNAIAGAEGAESGTRVGR